MKKLLLSTSALVGVGLVATPAMSAERIKLSLGGFMEQYVGWMSADDGAGIDTANFDNQSDTEIYVTGSTKLDNGITFSAVMEMEADEANAGMDESYLRVISPTLGELRLGGDDNAAVIMLVQANRGISGDYDNWIVENGLGKNDNLYLGASSDNNKVSYFSPKIAGFQVGASYTSDAGNDATDTPDYESGDQGPEYALAATYETTLGGIGTKLGVSTEKVMHGGSNSASARNYTAGAQFTVAGFTLSGGYARTMENPIAGGTNTSRDGHRYQASIQYSTGPYTVGVWHHNDENQGTGNISGNDETKVTSVYGNYTLSDGIRLEGMVFNVDYDHEAVGAPQQDGGWGAVAGFRLDF